LAATLLVIRARRSTQNPILTATFDKSRFLYRPARYPLSSNAQAIVVEGVMDALAIAAAAAAERGQLNAYAPVATSGLAVPSPGCGGFLD
jgi:DNA primase